MHEAALVVRVASIACGLLAFRGIRRAYLSYLVLALLYFPLQVGFDFHPKGCQLALNAGLALDSLRNRAHIVLFAIFYVMTMAQFREKTASSFAWAGLITIAMGAAVEILEGATGSRNCRLRDLVPDAAGIVIGAGFAAAWHRLTSGGFRMPNF